LIVDDDVFVRSMLAELLHEEGFDVSTASNGFNGLRLAAEQHPQVVLLDLMLPELSGVEVLHELRANQQTRNAAVLVVTGNPDALPERQLAEADALLRKPFDVATLLATLYRAVQRASNRAAEVQPVAPTVPNHDPRRVRRATAARRSRR
jgi:DNA-binding response OmpR family regulator